MNESVRPDQITQEAVPTFIDDRLREAAARYGQLIPEIIAIKPDASGPSTVPLTQPSAIRFEGPYGHTVVPGKGYATVFNERRNQL